MFSLKDRLKEILIRDNIIKKEDLDRALAEQKQSGGELSKILVRLKLINGTKGLLTIAHMPECHVAVCSKQFVNHARVTA